MKPLDGDQDKFWLGLEQLEQDPAFLKKAENEFISSPLKESGSAVDRRDFMKLMGASLALASTSCLERPVQKIIPYNKRPPEIIPGVANYYASTYFDGTAGMGVLVKTREGRPLFVAGNEEFPTNLGGLTPRATASVLGLYDPDRLRTPVQNLLNKEKTNRETIKADFAKLDVRIGEAFKKGNVRILTGAMPSPSTRALINELNSAGGRHVMWDVQSLESVRRAQQLSYGDEVVPRYRFDLAQYVVSIDCDFISTYLSPAEFAAHFARQHDPDQPNMSRFVAFESIRSLTGMNSDDRFRIKPSQQVAVVLGLAHEIIVGLKQSRFAGDAAVQRVLAPYAQVATQLGIAPDAFQKIAQELWENRGQSLVIGGGLATETARAVDLQVAINFLNSLLDNDGRTIDATVAPFVGLAASNSQLVQLIDEMKAGRVSTLIIEGSINPGYSLPAELGLLEAIQKVETVVYTGNYLDETAKLANFVVPQGSPLESWNDWEFQRGLLAIQQPTVQPIFVTRSFQDSLLQWLKAAGIGSASVQAAQTFYDYLRARWQTALSGSAGNLSGAGFEERWVSLLHQGYFSSVPREATGPARAFNVGSLTAITTESAISSGLELVLYINAGIGDGSSANNAWLQELPDPVTKIVWDNYLCVAPALAEREGLKDGSVVAINVKGRSLEVPVHVLPGMHDEVVSLALGYGRKINTLRVAFDIGQDATHLVHWVKGQPLYSGQPVTLEKTTKHYELANVQGHHSMEGRQIVVEATLASYLKDKNAGIHRHKFTEDIWSPHKYRGHKWGMVIDLSSCMGCSACVVACMSENNVPVVGKKYVLQGREMHWLRIDRYWKGPKENPDAAMQPMLCQHCENAPCERVCPVLATVHSDEGLNDMVYNRCVGTRYCSNNCPYKVRRFNWFDYTAKFSDEDDTTHMQLNPEVTVRSRGVMEKCTFCVQRIKVGKNTAKDEGRTLRDGEIQVACASVCPSNAIVFGDLNNPEARVSKLWNKERHYLLLEEVQTRPRIRYLAQIRNAVREETAGHAVGDDGHHEERSGHDNPNEQKTHTEQPYEGSDEAKKEATSLPTEPRGAAPQASPQHDNSAGGHQ